jgi:lysophospholipid acyltransferase (LPLAT)-like uncharacterized protein
MFKELKYFLLLNLLPPIIYLLLAGLRMTLRMKEINREAVDGVRKKGQSMIACFWHGRLLAMPFVYKGRKAKVLISRHRDGEFITRVIRFFGLGAVRASYRKATISAMREILSTLRKGVDIAVTPDGPKGPGYVVKKGIVELAKLSGNPIIPVTYSARKKKFSIPGTDFSFPTLLPKFFSSGVSPSISPLMRATQR